MSILVICLSLIVITGITYAWITPNNRANGIDGHTDGIMFEYNLDGIGSFVEEFDVTNLTFFDINGHHDDQDEALSMSDRIVVLRNGKIEQIDSPTDIYDKPNSLYVAEFIGDANVIKTVVKSVDNDKNLVVLENNISTVKYSSQMPEFYNGKALEYIVKD